MHTEIRSRQSWHPAPAHLRELLGETACSLSPAVSQAHAAAFSLQFSDVVLDSVEFFVSFQSVEMSVHFRESSGVGEVS